MPASGPLRLRSPSGSSAQGERNSEVPVTEWRFTVLGYQAGFAKPFFLALIPLALLLGGIALWRALVRRSKVSQAIPERLAAVIAPGVSTALPTTQASLYGVGLALM